MSDDGEKAKEIISFISAAASHFGHERAFPARMKRKDLHRGMSVIMRALTRSNAALFPQEGG